MDKKDYINSLLEDADSEGVEGKFYVWKLPEIETLLPKETADHFCKVYGVSEKGNRRCFPNHFH